MLIGNIPYFNCFPFFLPLYWNFACFTDEDTLSKFHRFRPQFVSSSNSLPTCYNPYEFDHTCYVECQPSEDRYPHSKDEDNNQPHEVRKCVSVPFVPPNAFQANTIAKNMANIFKEVFICRPCFVRLVLAFTGLSIFSFCQVFFTVY